MIPEKFYVADLGNSRIKIARIVNQEIIAETKTTANDEYLKNPRLDTEFSDILIFASVNSEVSRVLRKNNENMRIFEIGCEIEIPIKNKTLKPEQTGIDRLINCWFAYELHKKPVIVIDAGTAITIDYCNENGEFEGGIIMSGYELQLKALNEFTSALPLVTYDENPDIRPVGRTTEEAMLASVQFGIPGQINACIEEISKQAGENPKIYFTGGDSGVLQHNLLQNYGENYRNIPINNLTIAGILGIAKQYFSNNV